MLFCTVLKVNKVGFGWKEEVEKEKRTLKLTSLFWMYESGKSARGRIRIPALPRIHTLNLDTSFELRFLVS